MSRALDRGQQPIAAGALGDGSQLTDLNADELKSGTVPTARIPDLDATKITSGTVGTARLGSGTANSTTFLRGDNTWQTISTSPTTAQVLSATAGASVGTVGTYVYAKRAVSTPSGTTITSPGGTRAGSDLRYSGVGPAGSQSNGAALSGTWRCMGNFANPSGFAGDISTLWLRIS
jgi:hypothetical protein